MQDRFARRVFLNFFSHFRDALKFIAGAFLVVVENKAVGVGQKFFQPLKEKFQMSYRLAVVKIIGNGLANHFGGEDKNFVERNIFLQEVAQSGFVGIFNARAVDVDKFNIVIGLNGAEEQEQNIFSHK